MAKGKRRRIMDSKDEDECLQGPTTTRERHFASSTRANEGDKENPAHSPKRAKVHKDGQKNTKKKRHSAPSVDAVSPKKKKMGTLPSMNIADIPGDTISHWRKEVTREETLDYAIDVAYALLGIPRGQDPRTAYFEH
uniref:Uncharacterized protein n=1 Tax=Eutreptiella gymnastica TaxID=73025 RepID=A0A7S1JIG7_9EUGL|mmetsp:Transcript_99145/g.170746  ORF Transcript_99145/g.170746 Transcript_99145/m.170746 type:complete len:137 (+) Transcript_99145:207-617(+)